MWPRLYPKWIRTHGWELKTPWFRGWVVLNSSLFTRNFFFSSSRTKFPPLGISSPGWKNKQYTLLGICSDLDTHNANGSEHKSLSMYFFPFVPNRKGLVSILQVLSGFIESSEEETIGHGIFYNSQPVLEEQIAACNHGRNRNLFGSRSFEAAPPRVWKWNAWWILWFRLKFKSYLLR